MTTYVQSASLHPTARDLLNLLVGMQFEDSAALDRHIGYFDPDYGEYTLWEGKLEIEDGQINLSWMPSDVIKAEFDKARRLAEANAPVDPRTVDHRREVEEARSKGLLP